MALEVSPGGLAAVRLAGFCSRYRLQGRIATAAAAVSSSVRGEGDGTYCDGTAERGAAAMKPPAILPSEVSTKLSVFDRFATYVSARTSQAWFFVVCVVIVVLWAPSFFLLGTIDTWQLIINTVTTIVTFLLVVLLQNTQKRSDDAVQHKLNAIADGLADLMKQLSTEYPELDKDLKELRLAVGLEKHESAS